MSRCKTPLLCMCCNPSTVYVQHSVVRAELVISELLNQANNLQAGSQVMYLYGQCPTSIFWHLPMILTDKVMHRAFAGKLCDNIYMTLLTTTICLKLQTHKFLSRWARKISLQHLIKEGIEIFDDVGRVEV